MTKITKKALDQMREILTGSLLGYLKHKQNDYHCYTAHCVAGWNTVLNHKEQYEQERKRNRGELGSWCMNDYGIAQRDWDLTEAEATFMFGGDATRADQVGLIEYLADGHRYHEYYEDSLLMKYVRRYSSKQARLAWARKHDQWWEVKEETRPHSEFVEELLTKPAQVEEVVQVEGCTVAQV